MTYNEAETRFYLIDPVLRGKGHDEHWKLRLETPAPVEATGNKGRRIGNGRTDYLLCVQVGDNHKPLPVGVIEAKAETEDPLKTLESFHVCMPPVEEQQRIVARLSVQVAVVDEARHAAQAQLTEVEQIPSRILARAFGDL